MLSRSFEGLKKLLNVFIFMFKNKSDIFIINQIKVIWFFIQNIILHVVYCKAGISKQHGNK